jgi:S4 domain protein YaaA
VERKIVIHTETITLGQFLKLAELIDSGGMAKWFLNEHKVWVNGEQEKRRGRKLREGDQIEIPGTGSFVVAR